MRRTTPLFVFLAAGLVPPVMSLATTSVEMQVSRAGAEDWHDSIQASAGDALDIRVRVSFLGGPVTPLGLGQFIMQPTVSNWRTGQDTMLPLINNGVGGQYSTPLGAVHDLPGQYGRVIPYALAGTTSTSALMGHVNTVGGVNYLRIAQAQVTSWFGGSGNTTGGSGINLRQLNLDEPGRGVLTGVPFSFRLTNLIVFKFGIRLDPNDHSGRTMTVDAPLEGMYQQPNPAVGWFVTSTEIVSGLQDPADVHMAQILVNVPAPGGGVVLLCGAGAVSRKRVRGRRSLTSSSP